MLDHAILFVFPPYNKKGLRFPNSAALPDTWFDCIFYTAIQSYGILKMDKCGIVQYPSNNTNLKCWNTFQSAKSSNELTKNKNFMIPKAPSYGMYSINPFKTFCPTTLLCL